MSAGKPIQIVGGGPAGLTLGIALRRSGVPVTVFESGHYPRHRVCGEFISGHGLDGLETLGLKRKFLLAGGVEARNTTFFFDGSATANHALPVPALCLSRFVMDKLLADEFQTAGGELRAGERWEGEVAGGVVRASGRHAQSVENGWRCFGLKAHARNVSLTADLEMHAVQNGYVGLCQLAGGEVNVCGFFRRNGNGASSPQGFEMLRGSAGTPLNERLASAAFDEKSFCSVAGLAIRPRRVADNIECCIGDALTMIPPVTGNGLSLAFESALLAAEPMTAFSRGEMTWAQARQTVARLCDHEFSRRLAWANFVQRAMLSTPLQRALRPIFSRTNWFWARAFEKTR